MAYGAKSGRKDFRVHHAIRMVTWLSRSICVPGLSRHHSAPAVIFYGHVLTYAELDAQSDRFAALLMRQGVKAGDRVAVFLPNCPQLR